MHENAAEVEPRTTACADPPAADYFAGSRDLRLDLLRGLCLLKMIFSHGLGTPVHVVVSRVGFISAAEGFFLISGIVLGLVYRRRVPMLGMAGASRKLLRRAAGLWLINFALVLLYSAWDWSGRRWGFFHLAHTYDWVFWNDWHWHSLLSFDQPYFLQILPRYAVFLALAPAALWLLQRNRAGLVLALTLGLYLLEQVPNVDLLIPFLEHGRVGFRFSAWQALFFTGIVIGHERDRLAGVWALLARPPVLLLLAAVALAYVAVQYGLELGWVAIPERLENKLFARDVIGFGRLPNLLAAFVCVFWATTRWWKPISDTLGWLLLPLGQSALLAFVVHIPLSHLAKSAAAVGWVDASSARNALLVDLALIALVWAVARVATRRPRETDARTNAFGAA